jgi:ABC-type uncharacterized transport system substrate-binding protein
MRLIGLAVVLALSLALAPFAIEAQQPGKVAHIGYLSPLSAARDSPNMEAFRQGLRDLGYVEGKTALIVARYADGKLEILPELAAEIVRLNVDVIVAAPTPAVRAVQQATRTIPIVMAFSGDPLKSRLPTISGPREFVEAGGLVAYGPNFPDLFRRSAAYVDKILKGAKPADLPIEQPTKFDLVVNLKTAKALGLTVPRTVILQADQVIE